MIILRSCNKDGTSHKGFQWPLEVGAVVEAPDWDPTPECGKGLHGLRSGDNYPGIWYSEGLVQFLEVDADTVVELSGKVKFPRATVLFIGEPADAWAWAHRNANGCWYFGTATAGDEGTATAGDEGTATAGHFGTATAGYRGTATAGRFGTATAGYCGTATAGDRGTATAGDCGTATAGDCGTATAGDCGTATAGNFGTATAGYRGTATAGYRGTATAGDEGILNIRWFDGTRYRIATAYVGENGIKPNTPYRLDANGNFVEVRP